MNVGTIKPIAPICVIASLSIYIYVNRGLMNFQQCNLQIISASLMIVLAIYSLMLTKMTDL